MCLVLSSNKLPICPYIPNPAMSTYVTTIS